MFLCVCVCFSFLVFTCLVSYCCVSWVLPGIMIKYIVFGEEGGWSLLFSLLCGMGALCLGLLGLYLAVIGRLCSVIVALP